MKKVVTLIDPKTSRSYAARDRGTDVTGVDGDVVELELFIKNESGEVITPGTAQVIFDT